MKKKRRMKRKAKREAGAPVIERSSVYVNGRLVGFHENGEALANELRGRRREGALSPEVNIAYFKNGNELRINSDSGRARRPYIVVENGISKLTEELRDKLRKGENAWKDLVKSGVIEYLDAEEEENALVAVSEAELNEEHTHLEIDAVSIIGVTVGQLTYPEYNSSPRITMACAMSKQSLGLYASNFNIRMDSRGHVLCYPQQPLVKTKPYEILRMQERPAGQNFVVAIMSYYGYNMGDAVVMNRSAIERSLGRSIFYKTYETEERRYPGWQKDRFEIPQPTVMGYREEQMYSKLGEDGLIYPECNVGARDVLVGKTSPPRFLEEVSIFGIAEEKKRENSLTLKAGEEGVVDSVMLTESGTGTRLVKVRLRNVKVPENGDKFASRHGQKGVIGLLARQEDMPFTEEGVVPDLILNPHAIPSRMTAGHILEMLGGKACCMSGKSGDGTLFDGDREEQFKEALKSFGFRSDGKEVLYDGTTGERIEAEIFVGVVYYQRLHHLVSNKMHVRSRGPVQLLTHQPTEGRAREGGLRFGEMERDCLAGYGASMLVVDRLLEQSDKTSELVCAKCGAVAVHDFVKRRDYCPVCDETGELYRVEISYAFKLLLDEIRAIGIFPRLVLEDRA